MPGMSKSSKTRYEVNRRFTTGLFGTLTRAQAEAAAAEELAAGKNKVDEAGLANIVLRITPLKQSEEVVDLITGKKHSWPFKRACPHCGQKRLCRRGRLSEHGECPGSGLYVGFEVLAP